MLREAIYHKIDSEYAYAISKNQLVIKLRTKKNDVDKVTLYYLEKYNWGPQKNPTFNIEMKKVACDSLFDYYEVIINVEMISVCYYFEIKDGEETLFYSNYKFLSRRPNSEVGFFLFPTIAEKDIFLIPEWARESIVYHIFPDRFCNGDPSINSEHVKPWNTKFSVNSLKKRNFDNMEDPDLPWNITLGGDLQGIINKLDYLEDLGINTIYLTPVFESDSNHKYNTYNYFKIDPCFGTLEKLKELVKEAHSRNIRVILDAVFNHCGHLFPPFQDVLEKGENSQYVNWFNIKEFPVEVKMYPNYDTFAYLGWMPKLMTKNDETADYLISVATYWIKEANIDGWRLDVANEIDHDFWRKFRKAVKDVKEDAFIVGEAWHDAHSWLMGDQFDSTTNYLFTEALASFIAYENITVEEFDGQLGFIRGAYKLPAYNILWNLLDSHDTPRFLHACKKNVSKLKLAALIQMTYTGIPVVYYGTEVGMTGGNDPECRKGMVWDDKKQNKELLSYYKKLISIRKKYTSLTYGDIQTIQIDNDNKVYAYKRLYDKEEIIVYINNSSSYQLIKHKSKHKKLIDLLQDVEYFTNNGEVELSLPPKSGVVLYYN